MMNVVTTETATVGLDAVIGAVPGIISAFTSGGFWAGLAAVFAALGIALNYSPLKTWLARSPVDWLRPAIMLVGVGLGAGVAASTAGADVLSAVIAGLVAGAGSGYVQKFIQELRD